jgi:Flp pilus assembly protein TadD
VLNNLGCALKALGLLEDAVIAFNDSLAIQPTADAAINLASLHIETGDIENARHLIRSSKRIIPSAEMKQIKNFYKEVKRSERKPIV